MKLWVVLIRILFIVTQSNCDKGSCGPEMTAGVVRNFDQLCHSYPNLKRDVNQGFWYYKLNRIGPERATNDLSSGIRRPVKNPWLIKSAYSRKSEEATPWQTMSTWFKLSPPPQAQSMKTRHHEKSLDLAQIEMLVDPLNNGGSEIDMPIERWRRLPMELFIAITEFINEKCCKVGCHFPDDYGQFAKEKDMFQMLGC